MKPTQINFALASQDGRFRAVNGSRLVNLYPEILPPDSKVKVALFGTPGQVLFCSLPTGPVQGLGVMDGELYAVTKSKFYHVKWDGEYEELGNCLCSSRVSIATNGIQMVWVNGTRGYAYSITDGVYEMKGDGWYPSNTVTHQDGFFIFNRQSTGQFFISKLLSTKLDSLDYATAEASPDDTLAIISDQRALWLMGTESIEVWYNSGGDFPFQRMSGAYIEKGIGAAHSAAKLDNGIFFLGADAGVYRTNGYSIQRKSTHDIESALRNVNLSDAYAWSYVDGGHSFYTLTVPALNRTFCYDVSSDLWHDRASSVHGRHNAHCYAKCYDRHFVGDFQSGDIYLLDECAYTDNGDNIVRDAVAPVLHNGRDRISLFGVEVDLFTPEDQPKIEYGAPMFEFEDGSGGMLTEDGSVLQLECDAPRDEVFFRPTASLSYSDDNGETWTEGIDTEFGRSGSSISSAKWGPLGQFRQRHLRLTITDPVPVRIAGVYVEIEADE